MLSVVSTEAPLDFAQGAALWAAPLETTDRAQKR